MTTHFSIPSDWYQTFFTDPVIRFWDAAVPAAATEADVAFVVRHVGASPPATLLDVPCGSGRHALALTRAGFTVTGVDLSEAALGRASAFAHAAGLAVRFIRSDMLNLEVDTLSDGLVCLGNSFGYFEPGLSHQLLRQFAAALRAGGRLILDTSICAESVLPIVAERNFSFPEGSYEQEITYDPRQSIIQTRAQLIIDGERHELRYRHFVMTSGELLRSLRAAGFNLLALYGDAQDGAFAPGSPRLLLVAVKD